MASFALVINSGDPTTFQEAVNSQEKSIWVGAMAEEMESLDKIDVGFDGVSKEEEGDWV